MTKHQLIDEIRQQYPRFSRTEAETIVNEVFEAMSEALRKGERIELRGFGTFSVREQAARQARNPRTGAIISVVAKRALFFKVGKELSQRINSHTFSDHKAKVSHSRSC